MDSGYERILFAARMVDERNTDLFAARMGIGTRTPSAKAYGGGR